MLGVNLYSFTSIFPVEEALSSSCLYLRTHVILFFDLWRKTDWTSVFTASLCHTDEACKMLMFDFLNERYANLHLYYRYDYEWTSLLSTQSVLYRGLVGN